MIQTSLIVGVWNATTIQIVPIILVAHFFMNGDNVAGYLDVPTQNALKIRIDIFENDKSTIAFNATSIKFSFEGKINNSSHLTGIITSGLSRFPIEFIKTKNVSEYYVNRPQTPKRPFSYVEEQVEIINKKSNVILSGTFTYPKSKKPKAAVILLHGSGGNDRDETIADHKPFMIIANYLTKHNIAVLRYDERGIRNSTGNFDSATDIDFADDAIAALDYLKMRKETKKSLLGLVGHSKGGLTSIIASNRSKLVKFMILLGSPSVTGEEILLMQTRLILESYNTSETIIRTSLEVAYNTYQIVKKEHDINVVKQQIEEYFKNRLSNATDEERPILQSALINSLSGINAITTPWFRRFLVFNPVDVLKSTKIPVLGLWGSNDLQVPPKQNLEPMNKALNKAKNKNFKLTTFNRLNHLFQNSTNGSPNEYSIIEETFSIKVLELINKWIHKLI